MPSDFTVLRAASVVLECFVYTTYHDQVIRFDFVTDRDSSSERPIKIPPIFDAKIYSYSMQLHGVICDMVIIS